MKESKQDIAVSSLQHASSGKVCEHIARFCLRNRAITIHSSEAADIFSLAWKKAGLDFRKKFLKLSERSRLEILSLHMERFA